MNDIKRQFCMIEHLAAYGRLKCEVPEMATKEVDSPLCILARLLAIEARIAEELACMPGAAAAIPKHLVDVM